jgi:RNA 3'-terminal phosphate cyclase (ATP)
MSNLLEIDGAQGEGGGQILRSSLSLSLLTGRAFRMIRIRAGRARPGLQPQHLMCVSAAARVGSAQVTGDRRGSQELTFHPGPVSNGRYVFEIGTAGATALVAQTVLLPLALKGQGTSHVTIRGGTHVKAAPSFHFLEGTFRAHMERLGVRFAAKMDRPGFYPAGGGSIDLKIPSVEQVEHFPALAGAPVRVIRGFAAVSKLPAEIAERLRHRATQRLAAAGLACELSHEEWDGGMGTVLNLVYPDAVPTIFTGLGERGRRAEQVADDAVAELLAHHGAGPGHADPHSADQLVLPLALARGASAVPVSAVTQHLITNVDVVSRFLERSVRVEGREGEPGQLVVNG